MSDRYDPPGREADRFFGESTRPRGREDERGAGSLSRGMEEGSLNNGSIIPFEPFARRRAAPGDFSTPTGPLSSLPLSSSYVSGQMVLHGTIIPGGGGETTEEPGEQHLIFTLSGLDFGIKAESVQTVDRLPEVTPVPNVAHWIDGVTHLRGQVISVVDLRSFLGLERVSLSPRTRLIAGRVGDLVIGLVIDGISEMRGIQPQVIQLPETIRGLPAWAAPYIGGVATVVGRTVLLLDMERLLLSDKMHRYQGGNQA
ncbi:MAG TPA: chemotaxis protein CheW [Ktedonobacterales bacterium]|nr:chemotaxis protein CheW [Ktedonobacterales bacterium]